MSRSTLSTAERSVKWAQLLRGLDVSQMDVIAWVIEEEVRYLQSIVSDNDEQPIGDKLKLIIPAVRRALTTLLPVSAVDRLARITNWPKQITIEEVRAALDDAVLTIQALDSVAWQGTMADIAFLTCPLSERTYEALLSYPGTA